MHALDIYLVDSPAVSTYPYAPILLGYKQSWSRPWVEALSDHSLGYKHFNLPLVLLSALRIHSIGWLAR